MVLVRAVVCFELADKGAALAAPLNTEEAREILVNHMASFKKACARKETPTISGPLANDCLYTESGRCVGSDGLGNVICFVATTFS